LNSGRKVNLKVLQSILRLKLWNFRSKKLRRNSEETKMFHQQLMLIFAEFGKVKSQHSDSVEVQALVKKL